MAFYHKILFIGSFGILAPIFVFAQSQDFISIIGTLSNGQINLESVEQRVFSQGDAVVYKSGSYEARILKGKKVISDNFFEIVENSETWVDVEGNKPEERFKSNKSVFSVKLPLTENLDVANSVIEIWKGNSLLYSKRMIELPVEVLAANSYAVIDQRNYPDMSYLFHLYYDNGRLVTDRDFEFVYDVVPESFVPETVDTQFPFRGEIITFSDQVAGTFVFDPRRGNPEFLKGKISVKAPYAPNGQKAIFYNNQGGTLLTIFVSDSSFCNDDGVCNTDNGEDENTCPADCKGVTPLPPVTDGTGSGQGGMLMNLVYVLIIAGAGLGGWYGWKWWQGRGAQEPPVETTLPSPDIK